MVFFRVFEAGSERESERSKLAERRREQKESILFGKERDRIERKRKAKISIFRRFVTILLGEK